MVTQRSINTVGRFKKGVQGLVWGNGGGCAGKIVGSLEAHDEGKRTERKNNSEMFVRKIHTESLRTSRGIRNHTLCPRTLRGLVELKQPQQQTTR